MAGSSNVSGEESILFADNASFDGTQRGGALDTNGQLWIGSTAAPHVKKGTIIAGTGVTVTPGSGTITIGLSGGGVGIDSITPDSGTNPVVPDSNGLVTMAGSGSITTVGGTNSLTTQLTGLTAFNVLVGAGTSTVTKVAPSATSGVPLVSQGATSDPVFGTAVVAGGGTGAVTLTNRGVLIGQGTSAIVATVAGTAGQILQSGGAGANPAYSTATYPSTATGTGTILRASGTNWLASTTTYPDTNAINTLLYASSANVMAALPTANSAVLATNGSGVPSITATPTITSVTFGSGTALSSYVQGTFTPTITGSGGNPTAGYSVQEGRYTRIGNRVIVQINLSIVSLTGGSGNLQISTLPFTSNNSANTVNVGSFYTSNFTIAALTYQVPIVLGNVTVINFVSYSTLANATVIQTSSATATTIFQITQTYEV